MRKFIAISALTTPTTRPRRGCRCQLVVFTKTIDCAVGCNHDVVLPKGSLKADWKVSNSAS